MSTEAGALPAALPSLRWSHALRIYGLLVLALALASLASLAWGSGQGLARTFLPDVWAADAALAKVILVEIRLPRLALSVLVGFALGFTGAALQGFLRNPLAEPGLIGASSGAALGAVLVFYFGWFGAGLFALPFGGVAGALVALGILFSLAGRTPSASTLILAGVAINSAAGALTSLALNLAPNPFALYEILFWMLGSVADRGLEHVFIAAPLICLGVALVATTARGLDALTLGEDVAASQGIDLARLRLLVMGGSGLAVGGGVAVAGMIGFVGLVVPHLVRAWLGPRPGALLWPSGLAGALMLTLSDLIVRLLPGPELKLGVVTAMAGAPFFLALILRRRRDWI